jgi:four helix bundle protein
MRFLVKKITRNKSYKFALRIIKLYKYLSSEKQEYTLSKQVLRAGTSIGALIMEAEFAQSKKDFVNKLSIALKEANETDYWLSLLKDSDYIDDKMYRSIEPDIKELIKLLVSSINTSKQNLKSVSKTLKSSTSILFSLFINKR